jgi:hypothetical protein
MSDAWMPNIAMWVAPKDEQEFSSDMGTFKKNYVDYDRYSDECISRLRRFNRLLEVTGLEEQTKIPSEGHDYIRCFIVGGAGKPVHLQFGACPMLLHAPPCRTVITHPKICSLILPDVFSHYAGRYFCEPFDSTVGAKVPLHSVLYASHINAPRLANIKDLLLEASDSEPRWNSVTDAERTEAFLDKQAMEGK